MDAPHRPHPDAYTRAPRSRLPNAGAAWIWIVFGLCAIAPALAVITRAMQGSTGKEEAGAALGAISLRTVATSAINAGLIAALALLLAWPAACAACAARRRWLLALATPMLLPSYLAHAGWSLLRAPTTPLGRWIGAAPEHGLQWLPVVVGRAVAVWGLGLWAWPVGALVIALGIRALGPEVAESLRLDRCPAWRRPLVLARAVWPSIALALAMISLLMLGSAVPLHLARIETSAIRVWTILDEHPAQPWLAWIAAWPLVAAALLAGWLLAPPLARAGRALGAVTADEDRRPPVPLLAIVLGAIPWLLAVVVPLALFLHSLGSLHPLARFVRDAREGIMSGAAIASAVGLLGVTLALGASHAVARSGPGAASIRLLTALALAWALIPGVLVGSAVAQLSRLTILPDAIAAGPAPVVMAHTARFAFLPLLAGIWLGTLEASSTAGLRRLDGAESLPRWARIALPQQLAPALLAGLATACLSFHEIEASVHVLPPGLEHLPQRLLQWLHYERMDELSAAAVFLLGVGLAASAIVVLVCGRSRTPGRVYR